MDIILQMNNFKDKIMDIIIININLKKIRNPKKNNLERNKKYNTQQIT